MSQSSEAELLERLRNGPLFLLLGQAYLEAGTAADPLLRAAREKLALPAAAPREDVLAAPKPPEFREWITARARVLSPPAWLEEVARVPWAGVLATAVDSAWIRPFRGGTRDVQPIYDERYRSAEPRSRATLHCTFLFGSLDRSDPLEAAPLTRGEHRRRNQIAIALLRRLPDLVTPRGTLLVEGLDVTDWIEPADLVAALSELGPAQVHVFSASDALAADPEVADARAAGRVVLHSASLASLIASLPEGLFSRTAGQLTGPLDQAVVVNGEPRSVPSAVWVQTRRSATPLTADVLTEPPPLTADDRYLAFKSFLAGTTSDPEWSAYARRFAFRRDFAEILDRKVDAALTRQNPPEDPILLHGATGTGKTVALQALSYRIARAGRHPVLYVERRVGRPDFEDINRFCEWVEDVAESPPTVVVWDGMLNPGDYSALTRHLARRGRKALVVGTTYELAPAPKDAVEAPRMLTESEAADLRALLSTLDSQLTRYVPRETDSTFLVALYRLLPESRPTIRAGVADEFSEAEDELVRRLQSLGRGSAKHLTALQHALVRAKIVDVADLAVRDTGVRFGGEALTPAQLLTALVMVPGRLGLQAPLELVLRTIGHAAFATIPKLLREIRVIEWYEDALGNISLGPRSQLEAEIIVASRFGGPRAEIDAVVRLLGNIEEGSWVSGTREVDFAIELIRALEPESGPGAGRYAPYLTEVADQLTELRQERGISLPRLMLQEARLRREWAKLRSKGEGSDTQASFSQLQLAEATCIDAMAQLDHARDAQLRGALRVELAAARGARALTQLRHGDSSSTVPIRETVSSALEALQSARTGDPSNYYPIDVLAWLTLALVQNGGAPADLRAEATAELAHSFITASVDDFPSAQQERFLERQKEFADLVGDTDASNSAFRALVERGSAAGYYLEALRIAGMWPNGGGTPTQWHAASEYLRTHTSEIDRDARCLDLQLELWWLHKTGQRPLATERLATSFSAEAWTELRSLLRLIESASNPRRLDKVLYLLAVTEFHLGALRESQALFRRLSEDPTLGIGRRRVIRHFVAANETGVAKRYHGTVRRLFANDTKGEVYVDELRQQVQFIAREFRRTFRRGEALPEFAIAFNYLGWIAEPSGQAPRQP